MHPLNLKLRNYEEATRRLARRAFLRPIGFFSSDYFSICMVFAATDYARLEMDSHLTKFSAKFQNNQT
jgi:hypothetical protein